MNQEELAVMNGQIQTLNTVLIKLISALPPIQAAQMAVELETERQTIRDFVDPATPEQEIATQENLLGGYIELLSHVSKQR